MNCKNIHDLGNKLYNQKKYEDALEKYITILNSDYINNNIIYSNCSACYLKLKNYPNALEYALKSIELNINYATAWGRVGYAYKKLKLHANAFKAFQIAYKLNKNNRIYENELIFYQDRLYNKLNFKNMYDIIVNSPELLNNIKESKNEILNKSLNNKLVNIFDNIIEKIN